MTDYGRFEGSTLVHALTVGGGGEYTYCGNAYDAGDSGDLEGLGSWVLCKGPVTCPECARVIRAARKVRVAKEVAEHDEGD